jgi:hypothetical protein
MYPYNTLLLIIFLVIIFGIAGQQAAARIKESHNVDQFCHLPVYILEDSSGVITTMFSESFLN